MVFLFSTYFSLLFYLTFTALRRKSIASLYVSWAWVAFAVLPLMYLKDTFPRFSTEAQIRGVLLVSFTLLFSEFILLNFKGGKRSSSIIDLNLSSISLYSLSAILFLIPIINYYFNGLPLLSFFENKFDLAVVRNDYTRNLGILQLLNYANNIFLNFFGPIFTIYLFMIRKKYVLGAAVLSWVLFFALSSSAFGPFVIFCLTFIVLAVSFFTQGKQNLFFTSLISIFIIMSLTSLITATEEYGNTKHDDIPLVSQPKIDLPISYGDIYRISISNQDVGNCKFCDFSNDSTQSVNFLKYLRYRIFLDPIEVSNRWYSYYNFLDNKKRSFLEVISLKEDPKASNIIGNWAFFERFPKHYSSFLNANASIDAEAFSFGQLGVFFTLLLIFILRTTIGLLMNLENKLFNLIGFAALSQFAYLIFQAGPLAILIAQGLWIVFLFLLIYILVGFRNRRLNHF